MGPENKVLKECQTKAWDHLQTIELEELSIQLVLKVSEVEGMTSFDNLYTFEMLDDQNLPQTESMQAPCSSKRHRFGDCSFLRHLEAISTGRRGGVEEG